MKDFINNIDSRIEHDFHPTFTEGCSSCFSENRIIQSHRTKSLLDNLKELINTKAWDFLGNCE